MKFDFSGFEFEKGFEFSTAQVCEMTKAQPDQKDFPCHALYLRDQLQKWLDDRNLNMNADYSNKRQVVRILTDSEGSVKAQRRRSSGVKRCFNALKTHCRVDASQLSEAERRRHENSGRAITQTVMAIESRKRINELLVPVKARV
jgi:hypothetical protein